MTTDTIEISLPALTISSLAPHYQRALEIEKQELDQLPEQIDITLEMTLLAAICAPATSLAEEIVRLKPTSGSEVATLKQALARLD